MERFYQINLTEELVSVDLKERFRGKLALYRRVTDQKYISSLVNLDIDLKADQAKNLIREQRYSDFVLTRLLEQTPLYQEGLFVTGQEVTKNDLAGFCREAQSYKQALRTHVGIKLSDNVTDKPVRFLSKMLKLLGLSLTKTRSSGKSGTKQYFYTLDSNQKNLLDQLLRPLSDEQELELASGDPDMADRYGVAWCYLTQKYGHQFNSGQRRWMFPGRDSVGELSPRNTLAGHEKWAASVGLR